MQFARVFLLLLVCLAGLHGATFGTVVTLLGGASDIVLDELRNRLYLVNGAQNRVEVYGIRERRFLDPIRTDARPLTAAIDRDRQLLYVTSFDGSNLNVIDLDTLTVARRISLPVKPEGIAIGGDNKVLITTIGSGVGNTTNVLLRYDPAADATASLQAVPITLPPPLNPQVVPPSGRVFLTSRSQMVTSADGNWIVGVNIPTGNSRVVFLYEVASGTVLRTRALANASSVLSISPDGSRFMAGLTLFDSATLSILAQQNVANSPFPYALNTNFNIEQNQGGSVFSPDGSTLYSAFNIAPVQNPPARANVSQLLTNDPENLLIRMGLQVPENLSGKMVMTSDGGTLFALSESGFVIVPLSTLSAMPIARVESSVALLANDQCGVNAARRTASIQIRNDGRGRLTATAQVLQVAPTGPGGIGGGAGGGFPGTPAPIPIPPVTGVPERPPVIGETPTPSNPSIVATAPTVRTTPNATGVQMDLTYTSNAAGRVPGTVSPTHTFLVQSNEAVNIPNAIRVFQNFRDAESRGDIAPVEVGLSANEALEDMVLDSARRRIYLANSGLNRVEVYDIRLGRFLTPIRVGQLPRSVAMSPDGLFLYVANSGGENVSVIDLDRLEQVRLVMFPPLPANLGTGIFTPSLISVGLRGPQVMMNNGQIWRLIDNELVPRPQSATIGSLTVPAPRTMVATPGGEYILLLAGNGMAHLYDASADEFVQSRQVFANPIQGFYGPLAAGPQGRYYLANGLILNQALTPTGLASARPVSAVYPVSLNQFVRFVQPVRANASALLQPGDSPTAELVDVNTGSTLRSTPLLEGPINTVIGTARANVNGRTMVFDQASNTIYAITTSGLSIAALDPVNPADRPVVSANGIVSVSSYLPAFAPGSLISIFGRNLGSSESFTSTPLPTTLGNTCVTLNNNPLPLLMTSAGQINAQIPPELAVGRYPLVVRSLERKAASAATQIQVTRYAPGIFTMGEDGQPALFHKDGRLVTKDRPAKRDESLVMYATGLGVTKGGRVTSGNPSPSEPLAITDPVSVFFGNPSINEAGIIVEWSGLAPGYIGLYQINLRVPGARIRGDNLPMTLRIGGVESQKTGPAVPVVSVD